MSGGGGWMQERFYGLLTAIKKILGTNEIDEIMEHSRRGDISFSVKQQ
jgi:hypothetical protein